MASILKDFDNDLENYISWKKNTASSVGIMFDNTEKFTSDELLNGASLIVAMTWFKEINNALGKSTIEMKNKMGDGFPAAMAYMKKVCEVNDEEVI